MPESRTVKLRTRIELGSQTFTELTFRPLTAKDLRHLPIIAGLEMDALLALAGRLSGQSEPVIDLLSGEDLEEVIEIVKGFMPGGRRTGATPSPS